MNKKIKILTALLKYKGEISVDEIEAIPFIKESEVDAIVNWLISNYDVEIITQKKKSNPFLEWVKVIKLKKSVVPQPIN